MSKARLRSSEWLLLAFFAYIAILIPFFPDRPRLHLQPVAVFAGISGLLAGLAFLDTARKSKVLGVIRDWLPIPLTLAAFREMELFVPMTYNTGYEHAWIRWDDLLLNQWGFKAAVDALGGFVPAYLELCYLLIYGAGTFCIAVLWVKKRRSQIDKFYVVLLTGTLLAYALFPYFPSRPPRLVFPGVAAPLTHDIFRRFNLFLLRNATIHSGVFPSAHVSSAFAAAWAMFLVLPERKRYGWGLLFYAISVAIATIYGRYHYAADAVAGFGISLIAGSVALFMARRDSVDHDRATRSDTDLIP